MTANTSVRLPCINGADLGQQNHKTVECQLEKTFETLAATEANVELFTVLIDLGLATNDIKNFIQKQTIHKRTDRKPDLQVQKLAMRSKLRDACCFALRLRQKRDDLKKKLTRKYSTKKALGRRILNGMVARYKITKHKEFDEMRKKVEFIKSKEQTDRLIKTAPASTCELLSNLPLFSADQNTLQPQTPEGPFICDPSIQLDENERLLLAKGPKFMVREDLSIGDFNANLEKMVAKKKYDSQFNEKEDDGSNPIRHGADPRHPPKRTNDH